MKIRYNSVWRGNFKNFYKDFLFQIRQGKLKRNFIHYFANTLYSKFSYISGNNRNTTVKFRIYIQITMINKFCLYFFFRISSNKNTRLCNTLYKHTNLTNSMLTLFAISSVNRTPAYIQMKEPCGISFKQRIPHPFISVWKICSLWWRGFCTTRFKQVEAHLHLRIDIYMKYIYFYKTAVVGSKSDFVVRSRCFQHV